MITGFNLLLFMIDWIVDFDSAAAIQATAAPVFSAVLISQDFQPVKRRMSGHKGKAPKDPMSSGLLFQ
jgi:hypothetical protein